MTQGSPVPPGHTLLGWIDKHPTARQRSGGCAVLATQVNIEVAWDGHAIRSLPPSWRDKVTFEAAPAKSRNITQPPALWAAIEADAAERCENVSQWLGEAAKMRLPKDVAKSIGDRPPANRPKSTDD